MYMKKALLIIVIICLLLFAIFSLVFKDNFKAKEQASSEQPNTAFPKETNDITPAIVDLNEASRPDQKVLDSAFLQKEGISADVNNPGSFYLGNTFQDHETSSPLNYVVTYTQDTQFFNVVLLKEPLRGARLAAELYLRGLLGISEDEMCALKYSLSVPQYVSQQYSGNDLKFSFCPGSTAL